jgi:TolA-binding protein
VPEAKITRLNEKIATLRQEIQRLNALNAQMHEHILEAVQRRLDEHPKMRQRRETVEHPFGTIKPWMGSTHFQMKTLKHVGVGTEMALHVLAYNMKRVMKILGVGGLMEVIHA